MLKAALPVKIANFWLDFFAEIIFLKS
jgi:hypothetical protein